MSRNNDMTDTKSWWIAAQEEYFNTFDYLGMEDGSPNERMMENTKPSAHGTITGRCRPRPAPSAATLQPKEHEMARNNYNSMSREYGPFSTVIKPAHSDFQIETFAEGPFGEHLSLFVNTSENFKSIRLHISGMASVTIHSNGAVVVERGCPLSDLLCEVGAEVSLKKAPRGETQYG